MQEVDEVLKSKSPDCNLLEISQVKQVSGNLQVAFDHFFS